jgi:NDP-sugar pyrophosphorylase family protein
MPQGSSSSARKRAIVLAGGLGMRLRPYTSVLPKPLMPVGDRPVLDIVVRQLRRDGFDRVTIATGYLAELIEAFLGQGERYGVDVDYYREGEPLGTVGALALIDGLGDGDFLVMNGDVLTDLDYGALLERHRQSGAIATIATTRKTVQISLGVLRFDDASDETRLTGYDEKPTIDYDASMGIYCFSPRVLEHLNPGERLDFPDLVLRLVAAGQVVRAWYSDDFWLDIGRVEDYEEAMDHLDTIRERLIPPD